MRYNISRRSSTRAERIMYEILKELKLPFKHRWKIGESEIDFLVGRLAIDIDGHEQDGGRNYHLIELGLVPIHFSNRQLKNNRELIKLELQKYGTFN